MTKQRIITQLKSVAYISRGLYGAGQRFYRPLSKSKPCLNVLPHVLPTKPLSRVKIKFVAAEST